MQRHLVNALRYLVGTTMVVTGILKIVKPEFKVADNITLQAFIDSGWLWPLIGVTETIGGIGLFVKRFVPLGIAMLAPVVVGIFAFSLKTGGEEASVGVVLLASLIYLAWHDRKRFTALWAENRVEA
jgi:uncharacterized membrane protein YphA (DoxX/SURF4 family)